MKDKLLSVVLGSYNRLRFLRLTIDSIRRELELCPFPHEIIVVDGGSSDGSLDWLTQQKDILTIVQHNRGTWRGTPIERRSWGYFMNLAFRCAQGKFVCMLSDDCLVVPGAIKNGVVHFERRLAEGERVGAVAFYWRNWPEQEKYWVGLTLGNMMFVNHGLYLRSALEAVGYVDEKEFLFYHADGDLCLKMWLHDFACISSPDSYIEHYSHANLKLRKSNAQVQKEDWERYLKKWEGTFYHPEKCDIGDWLKKEFNDPHSTAQMFRKADRLNWCMRKLVLRVK